MELALAVVFCRWALHYLLYNGTPMGTPVITETFSFCLYLCSQSHMSARQGLGYARWLGSCWGRQSELYCLSEAPETVMISGRQLMMAEVDMYLFETCPWVAS